MSILVSASGFRKIGGVPIGSAFNPYGNKPVGYNTVLTNYGFTGAIPVTTLDEYFADGSGYFAVYNANGDCRKVTDLTAPISPSDVLEWNYAIGSGSPSESAGFGQVFRPLTAGRSAWYMSFSIWHDANFEFNISSNKMFAIWPVSTGSQILESLHGATLLEWQMQAAESIIANGDVILLGKNVSGAAVNALAALGVEMWRGKWINIEIEYICSTTYLGLDGTLRVWVGRNDGTDGLVGQLWMEHTGINAPAPTADGSIHLNSTWGGGNGPTTRTSTRRMDHLYVSHP